MNESITFVKNVLRTFEGIYDSLIGFANQFILYLFIPINELVSTTNLPNWLKVVFDFFLKYSFNFSIFELIFSFGILYIILINIWKFIKEIFL